MKKMLCLLLSILMMASLSLGAYAEADTTALDAFYSLTGEKAQTEAKKTNDQYLADILAGTYATVPADVTAAAAVAEALPSLTGITTRDIAAYASANELTVAQVRNAYYRALGNVLRAEIMVNPASEERYRNVQVILSLFLDKDDTQEVKSSREAIRSSMTPEHAATIAKDYQLPESFVEFVIMDEDWDDDKWDNDDDWKATTSWAADAADDGSFEKLELGSKDTADSTRVAQMQEKLIALGYLASKADGVFSDRTQHALTQFQQANGLPVTGVYSAKEDARLLSTDVVARWDYQDSFDDTPDAIDNTPDDDLPDNTPDDNLPDNTPNNTPDNTPDNQPDNTPNNTPDNQPDNTPDNSPDNSPAKTKAPPRPRLPHPTIPPITPPTILPQRQKPPLRPLLPPKPRLPRATTPPTTRPTIPPTVPTDQRNYHILRGAGVDLPRPHLRSTADA